MIDVFNNIDYIGSLLNGIGLGLLMFVPFAPFAVIAVVGKLILNRIFKD